MPRRVRLLALNDVKGRFKNEMNAEEKVLAYPYFFTAFYKTERMRLYNFC